MAETVFWPIYQEDFSHIDLCGKTANNINFHYRTVSRKINDHSFLYIKTPLFLDYFWVISPFLGGGGGGGVKKVFPENSAVTHNLIRVSSTRQKFRES